MPIQIQTTEPGPEARARKPGIRIRELTDQKDPALKEAYALLKRTFKRSERVLLSEWRSSMREKEAAVQTDVGWHLLVAERDGKVIGLASGTYLGNVNLGMIGYLASDRNARSSGVGTRLRGRLIRTFERDARNIAGKPLDGVLGEVSVDNRWLHALARRPNVLLLDFLYFQPRLFFDDDASPFMLYYESMARKRDRIPVGEMRKILYAIWRRIYRVRRPLDRPAFKAMMRALLTRRTIGRRPILKRSANT